MVRSLCSLLALALVFATAGPTRAQDSGAAGKTEADAAIAWAQKLWKEAAEFARNNAEKAREVAAKYEKALEDARRLRLGAEAQLTASRDRVAAAKRTAEALRTRAAGASAEAKTLRERLAFLDDTSGDIARAIDEGARLRLPEEVRAQAASAEASARQKLSAERAASLAELARDAASVAVEFTARDADSLRRLAYTLGLRRAERGLRVAQKAVVAALGAAGRRSASATSSVVSRARSTIGAALPALGAIRDELERAVRSEAASTARSLLRATFGVRRLPANAGGESPRTASELVAAAATLRAADAVLAKEPPSRAEVERLIDLSAVKERLDAAAKAAHEVLTAREKIWMQALDKLVEVAGEVSR